MNFSTKSWIPCVVCCLLLFFAATADFVSTSVVSGGYDANRPPVKIEHKCVSHAMAVGVLNKNAGASTLPSMAVERPTSMPIVNVSTPVNHLETAPQRVLSSPLRC